MAEQNYCIEGKLTVAVTVKASSKEEAEDKAEKMLWDKETNILKYIDAFEVETVSNDNGECWGWNC